MKEEKTFETLEDLANADMKDLRNWSSPKVYSNFHIPSVRMLAIELQAAIKELEALRNEIEALKAASSKRPTKKAPARGK